MSTTPVPTTAAAHLAMVGALEHASTCRWCSNGDVCDDGQRPAEKLRAALEGWEKRPRLRDDETLIRELRFDLPDRDTTLSVLDSVEAALFGPGPRTGGEGG